MIAVGATLLVIGAGLMLVTGLGLIRMPDIFTRMHAATKAASLGVAFMLLAAAWCLERLGSPEGGCHRMLYFPDGPGGGESIGPSRLRTKNAPLGPVYHGRRQGEDFRSR